MAKAILLNYSTLKVCWFGLITAFLWKGDTPHIICHLATEEPLSSQESSVRGCAHGTHDFLALQKTLCPSCWPSTPQDRNRLHLLITQLGDNYDNDNLIPEEEEYLLSPPWKEYAMSKSNGCNFNGQNEMEGTGGQKGRDRQEVRLVRKRSSQKSGFFLFFFSDFPWFWGFTWRCNKCAFIWKYWSNAKVPFQLA